MERVAEDEGGPVEIVLVPDFHFPKDEILLEVLLPDFAVGGVFSQEGVQDGLGGDQLNLLGIEELMEGPGIVVGVAMRENDFGYARRRDPFLFEGVRGEGRGVNHDPLLLDPDDEAGSRVTDIKAMRVSDGRDPENGSFEIQFERFPHFALFVDPVKVNLFLFGHFGLVNMDGLSNGELLLRVARVDTFLRFLVRGS